MNQKIVKQVAGIDVAQDELVVSLGRLEQDLSVKILSQKTFTNNAGGFSKLVAWALKATDREVVLQFVMEATGVYHEALAYHLTDNGYDVSIVLPNKISSYMRTLETKTITDHTSSEAILMFGLQRKLPNWQRPAAVYRRLQQLTRERDQLIIFRTMAKNRLHAERAQAMPDKDSVLRYNKQVAFFNKQIAEIINGINAVVKSNADLKSKVEQSCTIPGIGLLTAVTILAETNGFDLIKSKKQLVSYAGLDVREKQSGTSVKGKPKISKRGNRHLRKCLHMPALAAIKSDDRLKAVFARLVSKHGIKMKAAVAVQRKLLEMVYVLQKKNETYDSAYYKKLESNIVAP